MRPRGYSTTLRQALRREEDPWNPRHDVTVLPWALPGHVLPSGPPPSPDTARGHDGLYLQSHTGSSQPLSWPEATTLLGQSEEHQSVTPSRASPHSACVWIPLRHPPLGTSSSWRKASFPFLCAEDERCGLLVIKFYQFSVSNNRQENPYKRGWFPSDMLRIADAKIHIFWHLTFLNFNIFLC